MPRHLTAATVPVLLLLIGTGTARGQSRLAFINDGEVWVLPSGSGAPQQYTQSGKTVQDFRFSASMEYLAYAKRIRVNEQRPITSIVVSSLAMRHAVREIQPKVGWIDIDKWLATTLLYHASTGVEVSGFFEFDAAGNAIRERGAPAPWQAYDADAPADGAIGVYVDDAGVGPTYQRRLHIVERGSDVVLVAKRSLMSAVLSPAHDAVAFLEVAGEGRTARDRVWVYRLATHALQLVDDRPVAPKNGGSGLAWSGDGRWISVNFNGVVSTADTSGAESRQSARGTDACWLDARTLVVAADGALDTIDVMTGGRRTVVRSGHRPQCLAPSR